MSPPLGEEISARNSPGVPLPVLFGAVALMLIVPSMYNVVRSAFHWEPAPAPVMVVDGRTLFVTQPLGCADRCAPGVRFDNTNYRAVFTADPTVLGEPIAATTDGTVVVRAVPGSAATQEWVAVDAGTQGWLLARQDKQGGRPFPADVVCPSVGAAQQAACRAAAGGALATG